jgi:hypothetical protein
MNIYELIRGRRHYVAEDRVCSYLYQLMKSLDHMHRNGIFHRCDAAAGLTQDWTELFGRLQLDTWQWFSAEAAAAPAGRTSAQLAAVQQILVQPGGDASPNSGCTVEGNSTPHVMVWCAAGTSSQRTS